MTCSAPWRGLHIRTNGDITTCCAGATNLGNVHKDKFEDVLNSDTIKSVRQSIKDGKLHEEYCKNCIEIKKQNVSSELDWHNNINEDFDISQATLEYQFPTLFDARWNNTCNSNCLYCDETQSSKWASIKKSKDFTKTIKNKEYLNDFFKKNSNNWKAISLVGGEPLMIKENLLILESCPNNVPIDVITNLSSDLATSKVFDRLKQFKNVRWHISFDNVGEHYEYVREGSKWNKLLENFEILGDLIKSNPNLQHNVQIMSVLSVLNVTKLMDLRQFSKDAVNYFRSKHWPPNDIEIVWQPCIRPYEININYFGKEFAELFADSIEKYLSSGVQENEKAFFETVLQQMQKNMTVPTSEKQKQALKSWVENHANTFNNKGAFEKLYPEYTTIL